jgi:hypothetical protein
VAEAKVGREFIKHELDEAIAIQRSIVEAEERLGRDHPRAETKRLVKDMLKEDRTFLRQLEQLGRAHGATGKAEEVAGALQELMNETSQKASDAKSEAYEAQAVLLNLKRKQQDSAPAMVKIGRAMKDTEMRDAGSAFAKATKASAQQLAADLAEFAVEIATMDGAQPRTRSQATSSR